MPSSKDLVTLVTTLTTTWPAAALMVSARCQACVKARQKPCSLPSATTKQRTTVLKERGQLRPLFRAMAAHAEWLRTMPPIRTSQCGRSQNYGNESSSKAALHAEPSRIAEDATIQTKADFPYLHCSLSMKGNCSTWRNVAPLCFLQQCDQWSDSRSICRNKHRHNAQMVLVAESLQKCFYEIGALHLQGVIHTKNREDHQAHFVSP